RTWAVSSPSQAAVIAARSGDAAGTGAVTAMGLGRPVTGGTLAGAVVMGGPERGQAGADVQAGLRARSCRAAPSSPRPCAGGLNDSRRSGARPGTSAPRGRLPTSGGSAGVQPPVFARGHAGHGHEAAGEGALVAEAAGLGH